jgi:hypothetical protein
MHPKNNEEFAAFLKDREYTKKFWYLAENVADRVHSGPNKKDKASKALSFELQKANMGQTRGFD